MKDKHHQTCLYYCAREGKYLTSKFLIEECNTPVNEKDIYGQHPIYYSCREGKLDVCQLLLDKGADINMEDKYGQSCLYYAIRQGHYEIVEFLIKNGIDLNKVDKRKVSPILFAERNNQTKIADLLLQNGAIKPESKKKEKKEKKDKKKVEITPEEQMQNRMNLIESIQKPKKFILVKINENGEKFPLNNEELEHFKKTNEDVINLLNNKEELKKLVDECPDEMKLQENWEKLAKKLVGNLWKMKEAEIFQYPVDFETLGIPDYPEIVHHPMDFSTIKKKLNSFQYINCKEFSDDMNLVFSNCYLYNGQNSIIGNYCTTVKNEFEKLFVQFSLNKFV